jgi:hypothetical protein
MRQRGLSRWLQALLGAAIALLALPGASAASSVSGVTVVRPGARRKLTSSDAGGTVDVVVTASNSAGSGQAASAATALVTTPVQPPVNTAKPTIGGTAAVGDVLTASNGSRSNGPTAYGYQWRDCNSSGASCSNISGATSISYKLASSDAGSTIVVVVTASNAGGSASASSAATGVVVAGSSGALPSGVSLQAVHGGSGYYCSHNFTQACNDGWDSPSFFPIGPFWGNYAGEQSTWAAVDWNTDFYTTSQTDVNDLAANGLYSIPAGSANITPNSNTVGYDAADEPGSWSSGTSALTTVSNSYQDSRFWYVNGTWGMAQYGPPSGTPGGTDPNFFTDAVATPAGSTRHFDRGSIDSYWFSNANDSQYAWTGIGGVLYNGGSYGQHPLTAAETECGCRYGDMLRPVFGTTVGLPSGKDQASWHATYPAPIFQYVEDSNTGAHADVNITRPEMNWAVWSSIIHGARGVIYFDHEFGGSCISDNYITTSCASSVQSGQSTSIYSQMGATDSAVESLAPEINSETALGLRPSAPPRRRSAGSRIARCGTPARATARAKPRASTFSRTRETRRARRTSTRPSPPSGTTPGRSRSSASPGPSPRQTARSATRSHRDPQSTSTDQSRTNRKTSGLLPPAEGAAAPPRSV